MVDNTDAMAQGREFVLQLRAVGELFEPLYTDPFDEHFHYTSGIDRLLAEMKATRGWGQVRTTIRLPAYEVTDGLEQRMREAIGRYCEQRRHDNDCHIRATRLDGLGASAVGMLILFAGLALSLMIRNLQSNDLVTTFFGEGLFVVVAWVGLWYPMDALVYYWRPLSLENKALDAIRSMDLVLEAI